MSAAICRSGISTEHTLLDVMAQRNAERQPEGRVDVDDACLGAPARASNAGAARPAKGPFTAAGQTDGPN